MNELMNARVALADAEEPNVKHARTTQCSLLFASSLLCQFLINCHHKEYVDHFFFLRNLTKYMETLAAFRMFN